MMAEGGFYFSLTQQTVAGHIRLAEDAIRYKTLRPVEYYRSLKRVFEFLLNSNGVREAEQIHSEFAAAFDSIATHVDPISHISFLKNVGQYEMLRGNFKPAGLHLSRVLAEARRRNLFGQVRQVELLMSELQAGGNQGKLVTFAVAPAT